MNTDKTYKLLDQSNLLLANTRIAHDRFLMHDLPWDWRLLGIKGARGVGKTTLLLQRLQLEQAAGRKAVYLTLDDVHFGTQGLRETVEAFLQIGYQRFFLDEVHKYPGWAQHLKNLYDFYPDIQIVFSGSSIVELGRQSVDLSRRAIMHELPGLSFREYLIFREVPDVPAAFTLDEIFSRHREIATAVSQKIKPFEYFTDYLKTGYYPFFLENPALTSVRLRQLVRLVLDVDLAGSEEGGRIYQVHKLGQLLQIVAESVPFKPNLQNLARSLEIDRDTISRYLRHLHDARLIALLYAETQGVFSLQKPEKIYLQNTSIAHAIMPFGQPDPGNLRETFFHSQVSALHQVNYPASGDFLIDQKYTVEVGGKGKKLRQIAETPDSYLALDDMPIGFGRQIPLWLFGFLY
ncbi:MAG: AAA family ATPase [Saprospiraceae bacterium]|nr:AAA family ATPase [Saprospiraceae bacterium]